MDPGPRTRTMELTPGQRLTSGERTAYEIVDRGWEDVRHAHVYYRARKVFWNFRGVGLSIYEAGEEEWLDVLVRVPGLVTRIEGPELLVTGPSEPYPEVALDPERLRRGLDFELEAVLGRSRGPWFLE